MASVQGTLIKDAAVCVEHRQLLGKTVMGIVGDMLY
jgi:hypothetical protein